MCQRNKEWVCINLGGFGYVFEIMVFPSWIR